MDRSGSFHKLQFFLFNDMVLYANKIGWKYKKKGEIIIDRHFLVMPLPNDTVQHRILVSQIFQKMPQGLTMAS